MNFKLTIFPFSLHNSMDPFKLLHEDVHDHILQYLSANDLLRSSMVSKLWYQITAKSPLFNKRLRLSFNFWNCRRSAKYLIKSRRQYQDIGIFLSSNLLHVYENKFQLIMQLFSNSITAIDTTADIMSICDLPKLQKLTIRGDAHFPEKILSKMKLTSDFFTAKFYQLEK